MKINGIYEIVNKVNGKKYYGSSVDIQCRIANHKYLLNKNKHQNLHLQSAWNKYKKDNFVFNICENVEPNKLQSVEQKYLDICKFDPDKFYNISYDSEAPSRGTKLSEKTKMKMSFSRTGSKNPMYGKTFSEEYRKKLSDSHKGKTISMEQRMKMSKSNIGKHNLSDEQKEKLSKLKKITYAGDKNPRTIQQKYIFVHNKYGQRICRMIDLWKEFNFTYNIFYTICNGSRKSALGWKCLGKV